MDKNDILAVIESRLKELGKTSSGASYEAVGNEALISNLRRPRHGLPSLENLQRLADVLGLELYFGPHRYSPKDDTTRGISEKDERNALENFAIVDRYDLKLSAGPGSNGDNARPLAPVAFRKEWLAALNLSRESCVVVSVTGDSMEPHLSEGDLVLLDRRISAVRSGDIYGIIDIEGDTRVKRLEQIKGGLLLRSDNPECPSEVRMGEDANRVKVIGRLVWSGHTHNGIASAKSRPKRSTFKHVWL